MGTNHTIHNVYEYDMYNSVWWSFAFEEEIKKGIKSNYFRRSYNIQ